MSVPGAPADTAFGYLLVHFRAERGGEKIYFSLSEGDDPLGWRPLYGGRPALASDVGTLGVRDPVLARDDSGGFHVLATDLNVEGGEGSWETWVRNGSRSLVIWDSEDLEHWGSPRLVEVAPPEAGMAWAPEVVLDPGTGEHIVFWSSRLYEQDDILHEWDAYSRILFSRTRDFVDFSPAEVLIDSGRDIIDTAIAFGGGAVHRISKDEDQESGTLGIYHEIGSSLFADDFRIVSTRIGSHLHARVEAPILFRDDRTGVWYLFLDQYSDEPQGYFALTTDDISSGTWRVVPPEEFRLRPGTKHGGVLKLSRAEWERLAETAADGERTGS